MLLNANNKSASTSPCSQTHLLWKIQSILSARLENVEKIWLQSWISPQMKLQILQMECGCRNIFTGSHSKDWGALKDGYGHSQPLLHRKKSLEIVKRNENKTVLGLLLHHGPQTTRDAINRAFSSLCPSHENVKQFCFYLALLNLEIFSNKY